MNAGEDHRDDHDAAPEDPAHAQPSGQFVVVRSVTWGSGGTGGVWGTDGTTPAREPLLLRIVALCGALVIGCVVLALAAGVLLVVLPVVIVAGLVFWLWWSWRVRRALRQAVHQAGQERRPADDERVNVRVRRE